MRNIESGQELLEPATLLILWHPQPPLPMKLFHQILDEDVQIFTPAGFPGGAVQGSPSCAPGPNPTAPRTCSNSTVDIG